MNHRYLLTAVLALLPLLASGHPGHSAFDPAHTPHTGHAAEVTAVLVGALVAVGLAVRDHFKRRR